MGVKSKDITCKLYDKKHPLIYFNHYTEITGWSPLYNQLTYENYYRSDHIQINLKTQ